ncbi:MAG: lipocalin-like domain-containing protein [Verrucomicrobiota bacterium]
MAAGGVKGVLLLFSTFFLILLTHAVSAQTPASTTPDGFALPQPNKQFTFPHDHGSHPEFRTEWWYLTGHLDSTQGRRFGFQVTFFRQASRDASDKVTHLHLAHAALLDAASGKFLHEERLNREGWDAASSSQTLEVQNANWSLRLDEATSRLHLTATVKAEAVLKLELEAVKPVVIFGTDGVSRKGSSATAASHYLTFPRLKATGLTKIGNQEQRVTGEAWMDHEFSSSQLDEGQAGWDWAALQLTDGREIMVYRMRRTDGSTDAASTFTWIEKDASLRAVKHDGFTWKALATWKSPHTQASYPNHVRIECEGQTFELRPLAQDQEQGGEITGLPYWEGACDVLDAQGTIIGRAFLELAGYAGNLQRYLGGK